METIKIKSPTRVDLAGGTLDLWPLFNFTKGATTINVAIDIYTFCELTETDDGSISLKSEDLKLEKKYQSVTECLNDTDERLSLLKEQIRYWNPHKGFVLTTKSQSPVGGGLGGSSSLTVSLLKAFSQFVGKKFASSHEMVKVAHNIESAVLRTPTGTQDYYPAVSGGINILKYDYNGIAQRILDRETAIFNDHSLLVYTGKSHHSGINNFEVLTRAVRGDLQTLKALDSIKEVSHDLEVCLEKGDWSQMGNLFKREYKARVDLAESFSSPEINQLSELSLRAGAQGVKICGAGGGGCVLVWVEPSRRQKVIDECRSSGFQVLGAKAVGP